MIEQSKSFSNINLSMNIIHELIIYTESYLLFSEQNKSTHTSFKRRIESLHSYFNYLHNCDGKKNEIRSNWYNSMIYKFIQYIINMICFWKKKGIVTHEQLLNNEDKYSNKDHINYALINETIKKYAQSPYTLLSKILVLAMLLKRGYWANGKYIVFAKDPDGNCGNYVFECYYNKDNNNNAYSMIHIPSFLNANKQTIEHILFSEIYQSWDQPVTNEKKHPSHNEQQQKTVQMQLDYVSKTSDKTYALNNLYINKDYCTQNGYNPWWNSYWHVKETVLMNLLGLRVDVMHYNSLEEKSNLRTVTAPYLKQNDDGLQKYILTDNKAYHDSELIDPHHFIACLKAMKYENIYFSKNALNFDQYKEKWLLRDKWLENNKKIKF